MQTERLRLKKLSSKPKNGASARTIRRWEDPTNRTRYGIEGKLEPSANPNCTANRNINRFKRRNTVG